MLSIAVFGAGLALALDEWVYLIENDGTNASYLLPVSFWGGTVAVAVTCMYTVIMAGARFAKASTRDDT